jgi:hypothetical protein
MAKATKTDAEKKAEQKAKEAADKKAARDAEKAEKAKEREAEKKAKAEAKEKEQAEKAQEREAKKAAKEEEQTAQRQTLIDEGKLIEGENGIEFHLVEKDDRGTVEDRAQSVVDALKAAQKSGIPVSGRQLSEEFGGGWPQYLSFFSLLKVQGLVREYRSRGGERGESGVCYLWIGD